MNEELLNKRIHLLEMLVEDLIDVVAVMAAQGQIARMEEMYDAYIDAFNGLVDEAEGSKHEC